MKPLSAVLLALWALVVLQPAVGYWNFERHETDRIQAHLARVERALRARDVSALAPAQREARTRCLDALNAYWTTREFPHNHDFAGRRMPYFVDRHGTRCAMAALIEGAGGGALVRRVATHANNARVRELAGDPELVAWLGTNGMTVDEAAWVQPAYDGDPYGSYPPPSSSHEGLHATMIVLGMMGVGVNALHHNPEASTSARHAAIMYGVAAAAACFVTGGVLIGDDPGLSLLDLGVGAASLFAAVNNYNHLPSARDSHVAWRPHPGVRVSPHGVPQLAVRVEF